MYIHLLRDRDFETSLLVLLSGCIYIYIGVYIKHGYKKITTYLFYVLYVALNGCETPRLILRE
jgi:hypothetical protein